MNTILIILLCLIVAFLVYVILLSWKMSSNLSKPTYKTYEFTIDRSKNEEHSWGELDSYEKEPFEVTLRDGYVLHGDIYPLDPKKVVIISHGHGDNKYTGVRFLQTFRNLGYSTVIYDLRGHGHNEPHVCTMGLNESKDLMEVIDAVKCRFPRSKIGLHGLSMGCATTVMALKYKPDVEFVVADCGYGILKNVCEDVLRGIKQPLQMFIPVNWTNRIRFGYNASNVNPIDSLVDNEIPILFIHGAADDYVAPQQSEWMYDLNKGSQKELHLIPGAGHAHAWNVDPAAYERIIAEFIEKTSKNAG
ncbi:MAG: alpha/beta hydrolase [Anaerolineaceae bacterium]|nr:alpha/beta hydrolase [Anaerolineaceae bacterium]